MTRMSKSKTRSVAAIGKPPREPAARGPASEAMRGSRDRESRLLSTRKRRAFVSPARGDSRVIPAHAGIPVCHASASALRDWAPASAGPTIVVE
jgi:hypothetical protein